MAENIIYKDYIDLDTKRQNRPLNVNGEKVALTIAKKKNLQDVDQVFSSTFFSAIDSAKYLSDKLNLDLVIDNRLNDRVVGDLNDSNLNLRNLQEHDFDYKLVGGESLNDVKERISNAIKEIIQNNEDSSIAVFTHNIPALCLLSIWCEKGFNYEEKLILDYKESVIYDGMRSEYNIYELVFEKEKIIDINKIN